MKKARFSRYYLLLCLPVLVALVGLVWGVPVTTPCLFSRATLSGRYISAETAYDVSSVHATADETGNVGSPVFFAATGVMVANGKGFVCGQSDGFYGGTPPPGVNTGPAGFHGTYTVDSAGRVTITTCADTEPGFCADTTTCTTNGTKVYKTQVGYLLDIVGSKVSTVEQINSSDSSEGGCCATTGFLVHARMWTKIP
ncbi:MAG: hypothetical protein WCD04_18695 [Terriglobia bacterium]|jgi:hypothetical protein